MTASSYRHETKCSSCTVFLPLQAFNAAACEADGCPKLLCFGCLGLPRNATPEAVEACPPFWCRRHAPRPTRARRALSVVATLRRNASSSSEDDGGAPDSASCALASANADAPPPTAPLVAVPARFTARRSASRPAAAAIQLADGPAPLMNGFAVGVDLGRLRATVLAMTPARAWEWADHSLGLSSASPRRHLPGSGTGAHGSTYSRRLAAAAALIILDLAAEGEPAAQIISLSLPRIILRRDCEIPGQVHALSVDALPLPTAPVVSAAPDPTRAWCQRLLRAHASNDARRTCQLALEGPDDNCIPAAEAAAALSKLFPHKVAGELPLGSEAALWRDLSKAHVQAAPSPVVTARGLVQWARRHKTKAADAGGWTGQLVVELHTTEPLTADALARFWSLPLERFLDPRARNFAFRDNNGTLLRREGKDPRPISAPNLPRKVISAIDARRARPAAAAFCESRDQLGLSRGGALLAYSILPRVVVDLGGTTCAADNAMSYQSFTRQGLLDGARALLASPVAALNHPEATTAYARLMSTCVFDSASLPQRTSTTFHRIGETRVSHALAQGCSSSPTAEAVTLAAAPPPPVFPRAIRLCAHDDSQASGLPGCDIDAFAPPPAWGGAAYNTTKSVAVGPRANILVDRGYAARAASHATVFGAPVGDVDAWALEVWAPRFRTVMTNLQRAFECDAEAAIVAAHAIRGPGASASHWLRCAPVPPGSAASALLAQVDAEWVRLWLHFGTRGAPAVLNADDMARCWQRVYGTGPACLSHVAASESAESQFAAGRADAWPCLSAWAARIDLPWATLARALGTPPSVANAPQATTASVARHFNASAAATADAYRLRTLASAAALTPSAAINGHGQRLGCGAVSSIHSTANRHPNLWIAALGSSSSSSVTAGSVAPDGMSDHASLIVAYIFGLPVWGALSMQSRPTHCRHCLAAAPASSLEPVPLLVNNAPPLPQPDPDPPHSAAAEPAGSQPKQQKFSTRQQLDDFGDHIAACNRSGILAGGKWRHDSIIRSLAVVSAEAGREGKYHDGPIFKFGPQQRPADLIQRASNAARYPSGEAIDGTFGLRCVSSADSRENEKCDKFADQLALNQHLAFRPFGATTDGDIGPQANSVIADWCRSLAAQNAALKLPPGDGRGEVLTGVARAFTRAMIFQALSWKSFDRGGPRGPRFRV